jgi:hypothetical protein
MSLFPVTKKQPCELHEFLCCALPQNINVLFLCPCLLALSKTPGGTFHVFGMVALALKALHQIPHHRGLCPVFAQTPPSHPNVLDLSVAQPEHIKAHSFWTSLLPIARCYSASSERKLLLHKLMCIVLSVVML